MSINNSDFLFQRRCFCIHMINCPVMLDFDFDSDFGITQFFARIGIRLLIIPGIGIKMHH